MRIKNLVTCYVYSPIKKKIDGETSVAWQYKDEFELNSQQDINELDVNEAGVVDYDRLKIRIDYDVDIQKGDGISFKKLKIENGITKTPPEYKVIAKPRVGKATTYTCEIYHGE